MKPVYHRREFLAGAAALAAGVGLGLGMREIASAQSIPQAKLKKALIREKPSEDDLRKIKDAGFDGVEAGVIPVDEAAACRKVAERLGMRIHSVLRGWAEFNSPDPATVQASFRKTEDALRAAEAFGAETVLLVPCRIGGMKMPKPHEFEIEFDDKTGHVAKVVAGDNGPYAEYIQAHNHAADRSREEVKRLIPLAEQTGVVIALENVWNNLWVKPAFFQNFVASFGNPWVKAYFDIGNHVKYAPPEEWLVTLGKLVAKCHVKDFKLNDDPGGDGAFVQIRDGSVNWPRVRGALDKIGYTGWLTIEGEGLPLPELGRRLGAIINGE